MLGIYHPGYTKKNGSLGLISLTQSLIFDNGLLYTVNMFIKVYSDFMNIYYFTFHHFSLSVLNSSTDSIYSIRFFPALGPSLKLPS
jgi:hypothetical protein